MGEEELEMAERMETEGEDEIESAMARREDEFVKGEGSTEMVASSWEGERASSSLAREVRRRMARDRRVEGHPMAWAS